MQQRRVGAVIDAVAARRVELEAGEAVTAEVGKFIFARGVVEWDVTLPWRGRWHNLDR